MDCHDTSSGSFATDTFHSKKNTSIWSPEMLKSKGPASYKGIPLTT